MDEPSGLKDSTHLACDPLFRLFVRVLNPPISPASWNRYTHSARLLRECVRAVYYVIIGQQSSVLFSTRIEFGFVCSRLVYLLLSFSPLRQQVKYSLNKKKTTKGWVKKTRPTSSYERVYNQLKPKPAGFINSLWFFQLLVLIKALK